MFTGAQRRHLHAVSLSRIICDNSHVTRVPANPFSRTERAQDMLPCSHPLIPPLDLSPWKEPDAGEEEGSGRITSCLSVCFDDTASCLNLLFRSCLRAHTQDSLRLLAALRLSGSLPVSLWLQAAGILLHHLSSQQPAVELRPSNMPRCGETNKALVKFSGDISSNFPIMR